MLDFQSISRAKVISVSASRVSSIYSWSGNRGQSVNEMDMEVMKMTRFIKILGLAGVSSVYLMQGACTISGDGISLLPNIQAMIAPYLAMIGL